MCRVSKSYLISARHGQLTGTEGRRRGSNYSNPPIQPLRQNGSAPQGGGLLHLLDISKPPASSDLFAVGNLGSRNEGQEI